MSEDHGSSRAEAGASREGGDDSLPKFTRGPWRVADDFSQDHGQFSIIDADGAEIGSADAWIGEHRTEANANAHLIASAPELYAALRCLLEDPRFDVAVGGNPIAVDEMLAKGRDALAKARGET